MFCFIDILRDIWHIETSRQPFLVPASPLCTIAYSSRVHLKERREGRTVTGKLGRGRGRRRGSEEITLNHYDLIVDIILGGARNGLLCFEPFAEGLGGMLHKH